MHACKLWTSVQKSPSDQERFVKVGKARAFLDAKTKALKAESYAKCSYEPYWVLSCHSDKNAVEMGTFDAKGDIT